MNILVQLAHPAQFYFYRIAIANWKKHGHKVLVVIKTKDILEMLLKGAKVDYYNINDKQHRGSKFGMLVDMLIRDVKLAVICIKEKVDILTGSTAEVAQIAWLLRRYSVCIGEDDANIVPIYVKSVLPFLQTRLTPDTCRCGKMEPKSIHYAGFQKLAYLHPNVFTPNKSVAARYGIEVDKPFFLLRLVSLTAHHDKGIKGLNAGVLQKIIDVLSPKGQIYISSERVLEPQFEQYRLHINPLDIHHVMAYATIYIGDSQSMAVEAAMLGVPNIRYNDFVGKKNIGVLEELEYKYKLTQSISTSNPELLFERIEMMLNSNNLQEEWKRRKDGMIFDKIDVSEFLTWFIENYPESKRIMRENPEYQEKFKGN